MGKNKYGNKEGLKRIQNVLVSLGLLKFAKHYIWPFLKGSKQALYNPQVFFESRYKDMVPREFSDRITIRPDHNPLHARYHYNSVENAILESLIRHEAPIDKPEVLDIGSGTGHWISFYLDVFDASKVMGIEISGSCVVALQSKFTQNQNVSIRAADVSAADFDASQRFDIINAIGVIFHIVEDSLWEQAMKNLARHLKDNGVIIVGGQFGSITRNVQFHDVDDYNDVLSGVNSHEEEKRPLLVNKRIRSLRRWRKCAKAAGLRIRCLRKTKQFRGIITPENNILVLTKAH